jgi:TRAP-type C4-dicarboxylate transport system permease small subunit
MLYKFWEIFSMAVKKINNLLASLCGLLILFTSIIVTYNVLMRYLFSRPSIWIDEVSSYMLAALTFLGAGYTLLLKKHINVDILILNLSEDIRNYLDILTSIISMIVCVVFTFFSFKLAQDSILLNERTWTSLRLPIGYLYLYFFIGMFMLSLQYLVNIIEDTKIIKTKH